MRVLVTGGTGFIGSHLVERLARDRNSLLVPVRALDRNGRKSSEAVRFVEVDLLDGAQVRRSLQGIDTIYHLASIRGSGWSLDDSTVRAVNVGVTANLLAAAVSEGVRHFVYVSSVSVFGHPRGGPIDENQPCRPVTRYGRTKYESERLVGESRQRDSLATTILRPVITYGPGDTWGMVPKLVRLIQSNRYATVGSGENRVHLIYVEDLIDGLMLVLGRPEAPPGPYILASAEPVTINRLVETVARALQRDVPKIHVPAWLSWAVGLLLEASYRMAFIGHEPLITRDKVDIMSRDRFFDASRAGKEIGFAPKVGYDEGIRETVSWLKASRLI